MKALYALSILLCLASCGSLKLSPQGCKSPGFWGGVPSNTEEVSKLRLQEFEFAEEYYVLALDKEIRLRDFLKEKGVKCADVKKIRVRMSSAFFLKRKLNVTIAK